MEARSFYEPYIKLMWAFDKISSENLHKNPLGDDFEKIWRTLSAEVQEKLNCEQSQITFKQGTGKNKLRNFPFSQSLLSEIELNALEHKFPLRQRKTEENAKSLIRRNEGCLKNRSKKKLSNPEFIDRISQQLIIYLKHNTHLSTPVPKQEHIEVNKNTIEIICITEGFGPDLYELISRDQNLTTQKVTSFYQIESCFANGFSLFLSNSAGYWVSSSIFGKSIADFRSMILGINKKDSLGLVGMIASVLGVESVRVDLNNSIHGAEHIDFYEIPFYELDNQDLSLEKIFSKGITCSQNESSAKIEFSGGVIVDSRKKRYLVNYPPTEINFSNHVLSHNEVVEVNEGKMTVCDLFSTFKNVKSECNFHIRYRNSNLTIGFEKTKFDLILEVPVNQIINDRLRLSKRCFTQLESESCFSHFSIMNYRFKRSFQLNSKGLLKYSHIPQENWVALPHDGKSFDVLSDALKKCELSYWLQAFLRNIILTKRIPYPLLLEIEAI